MLLDALDMKPAKQKLHPDNKVHGANMGLIWGRQDPGGPHVGPVNLAIWVSLNILANKHSF